MRITSMGRVLEGVNLGWGMPFPLKSNSRSLVLILIFFFDHAEYDWENSHYSKVAAADQSHDQSLPLHHDDVIIKAVSVQQDMHSEEEQVYAQVWNRVDYILCTLYLYCG